MAQMSMYGTLEANGKVSSRVFIGGYTMVGDNHD